MQAEAGAAGGRGESLALCFHGFGDKLEREASLGWLGGCSPLAVPGDFAFLVSLCQWHPRTLLVWEMVLEFSWGKADSRGFLALFPALSSLAVPRSGGSSELPFCLIQL